MAAPLLAFCLALGLIGAVPQTAHAAQAAVFDPGYIISDAVMYDSTSIDAATLGRFIDAAGADCVPGEMPCLKDYTETTVTIAGDPYCKGYQGAKNETAEQIITKSAVSCRINPKILLVMLQKEAGLVLGTKLTETAYEKAMGFACPDTSECDPDFLGFANQVYHAARRLRDYAAHPSGYNYVAGRTNTILYNPDRSCGTAEVYIQNQATAALYIYTPYVPNDAAMANIYGSGDSCSTYGNRNFWRYYTDWFGDPRYGSFAMKATGGKTTYLVVGTQKYPFPDQATINAYAGFTGATVEVSQAYLDAYPTGAAVSRFVLRTGGDVFFVENSTLHYVSSCSLVTAYGGSCSKTTPITTTHAAMMGFGDNLTRVAQTPSGTYAVQGGQRRQVADDAALADLGITDEPTAMGDGAVDYLPLVPTGHATLHRFYNATTGAHFYTDDEAEKQRVVASYKQFKYEGVVGYVLDKTSDPAEGELLIYRFYNAARGVHFYTADADEAGKIKSKYPEWTYEEVAFTAYAAAADGTAPVYRFYNATRGCHFYTANSDEADKVKKTMKEWSYEGVAYHILTSDT